MSFSQNNYLINIEKHSIKIKNKSKKLIPSKPSYLLPSSTLKCFKEKEVQNTKKDIYYKFNNHPLNINLRPSIRNRNYNCKDISSNNNTLNNSNKNVNVLFKNNINNNINNNNDYYRNIININNNLLITNNSIKNFYNFYDNNDENKENMKNRYNMNFGTVNNVNNHFNKNEKTIMVNKAKFIKDNKITNTIKNNSNNIYKKINLKPRVKKRTLSSNINNIIPNINIKSNNENKYNNMNIKKSFINETNDNYNNSFLNDIFSNHKKNNSIIMTKKINLNNKNNSLKKLPNDTIKASRSFSSSVGKIMIKKKQNLSKNHSMNKKILKTDDNRNKNGIFTNTGNNFYSRLKQSIPFIKTKNNNSINKNSEYRNNSLNKSFTTNNFIKRFNLSQYEKMPKIDSEYNQNKLNSIEQIENCQKIKDYFLSIRRANNNLITNNMNLMKNKLKKRYKNKSISDLSHLDINVLNKSKDSCMSQKNYSIMESERKIKKKIIKKILKIDSCTIPGYTLTGVKQKNQDSFFLIKNFLSQDEHFFIGICDGHGLFGDLVSQYISQTLPHYVKNISDEDLIQAFIDTNNSLVTQTKIDCSLSGTTCTSLIITLDKIICANIGNTRAILAKFENGCYNTVNLSRDHKPTESDEIKRILAEGGMIKQLYDKNKKEFYGPERIWLKNSDIPGLSMSRSFGDNLAHTVGVNNIPEIRTFDYTGGEKFIVIASDSIWQYIDSDECVRIIKDYYEKNMDAVGALNSLVTEAIKRWKKQENKIEDITAVVIFFE